MLAFLGSTRISLQVDVGFGDAVTPEARLTEFPTLLNHPKPVIRVCPAETVVAEKLEAMVSLGIGNSRMKDFYDVWVLIREFDLDRPVLAEAIRATFERRGTSLPSTLPVAFSDEFMTDATKQNQWKGFLARSGLSGNLKLPEVIATIRDRLAPLIGMRP